ncbi:MAG: TIGR01777 family oxidoreductase, partial [Candidatus Omnitrophica bacterium]|nr:TIGR01777 family oxidoreductase [Candidatus Omnitrophota bacterium]
QSSHRSFQTNMIHWDPSLSFLKEEELNGFDAVIHLSGSSIGRRWTPEYKKEILDSRVQSTTLLCEALSKVAVKPKVLICASAVGFYGPHSPRETLDEASPSGTGFLADVCRAWEQAVAPAVKAGIRVVHARFGLVLSQTGGALAQMLPVFRWGLGGPLGDGQQAVSWVSLDEIPFVVEHLIRNEKIDGAVNVCSPQSVSNAEFTRMLGQALHRPAVLPVPAFAVNLLFGEMGQSLLLEGAKVNPKRLQESGYQFHYPDLKYVLSCLST